MVGRKITMKKIITKILLAGITIVFFIVSIYLIILLNQEEKPVPTTRTKAANKTYRKILALNNPTPTTADINQSTQTVIPTPTYVPSPTTDIQQERETPTPTEINLLTTPLDSVEEEGKQLALNNPTVTKVKESDNLTPTRTKSLPETGILQNSLTVLAIFLVIVFIALII